MNALAVKQAVKFAKEYALENGPLVILCLFFPSLLDEKFMSLKIIDNLEIALMVLKAHILYAFHLFCSSLLDEKQ